jgi:hypothetical protein
MRKVFCFGIPFLALLMVLACKSTSVTASVVPYVYTNNPGTPFTILGEIQYESKDRVGYTELLKAARNLYPDCDYVIDVMLDQKITTTTKTTEFFMRNRQSVQTDITWVMRGTAIKYRR